jgi:hypothetical protein
MNIADTIKILRRLRLVQTEYPTHLLESRRADFFEQVAAIRADMKANQPNSQSSSSSTSGAGNSAHIFEQLLQYVSIGMFVAASALGIYTFRDDIINFFSPNAPDIQITSAPDLVESPIPLASESPTLTPTSTNTPFSFTVTPQAKNDDAPVIENTPIPTATKPGLRIGHTKTPKP